MEVVQVQERKLWGIFHLHTWSKWKVIASGPVQYGLPPLAQMFTKDPRWYTGGEWKKHKRHCLTCDRVQIEITKCEFD
jgi:hypothetical protein